MHGAVWAILVPLLAVSILVNVPSVLLLIAFCVGRIGGGRRRRLPKPVIGDGGELPTVLVQIPSYNESAVIERVVEAAARQDWPRDRLQIQILDDSTDRTPEVARSVADRFNQDGVRVELRHRTDRIGFKAGALQAGLDGSSAPFVAILDADYVPSPDWLRSCMANLLHDSRLAFVQSRITYLNRDVSWLTRGQAVLLDNHYVVEQGGRQAAGLIVPFNGTCGVWRRQAIEAVGGWSGDTLVEDMDLSFRTEAAGWRGQYLLDVSVPGELPASVRDWMGQQRRWSMGTAQIVRHTLKRLVRRETDLRFRMSLAYQMLNVFAAQVSIAALLAGAVYWSQVPVAGDSASVLLVIALCLMATRAVVSPLVAMAATRPVGFGSLLIDLPCSILVLLLGAGTGVLASIRGLLGRSAPFVRTRKTGSLSGE